jgi:hypothetical protein
MSADLRDKLDSHATLNHSSDERRSQIVPAQAFDFRVSASCFPRILPLAIREDRRKLRIVGVLWGYSVACLFGLQDIKQACAYGNLARL